MDLFKIIFDALSPYLFSILKLAFTMTLFTTCLKIIRSRNGGVHSASSGNPYAGITTAFIGYLCGRGIPVILGIVDRICNDIINHVGK